MKNNFVELDTSKNVDFNITSSQRCDLFEMNEANLNTTINFYVTSNIDLLINMSSINSQDFKKKFIINIYLQGSGSNVVVRTNCLGIGKSNTAIEVNGICDSNYDSKINIQIDGIIDSPDVVITGKPKFIFKTNTIEARHGLTIGKVNEKELTYLLSRGIDAKTAKYMLISAKLFDCLKTLPAQQNEMKRKQILNIWGETNA